MEINYSSEKPIFLQIAEGIEDAILSGAFAEDTQIPSITEFSVSYTINPATALKGINILVENGILYKKRGVGMFVSEGAAKRLAESRKAAFFSEYVETLVLEAKRLGIGPGKIKEMVDKSFSSAESKPAERG